MVRAEEAALQEGKKGIPGWVWIVVVLAGGFVLLAVGTPLAIYGVRTYMVNAKRAEARAALMSWGDGLARCGENPAGLPPSTNPVPTSLSVVAARKYQSAPTDWNEQAHTCSGFSMSGPQYFQYSWELTQPSVGAVHAVADLDGDGVVDEALDLDVTCAMGRCQRGAVTPRVTVAGGAKPKPMAASGSSTPESATSGTAAPPTFGQTTGDVVFGVFCLLCMGGVLVGSIWGLVQAFQVSAGWGFLALCVPCARFVFVYQHWSLAKRPFLISLASYVTMLVGTFSWVLVEGRALAAGAAGTAAAPGQSGLGAPDAVGSGVVVLPPLPPTGPLAPLLGEPADLSSVMGRARKLANQWQKDAALVGIESTLIVAEKIQTQEGGSAKLTFGPSSFNVSEPRSGLYVVSYDKLGLKGESQKGNSKGELPEPMCAPEFIYRRMATEGRTPSVTLRYELDDNRRPVWKALLAGDSKAKPLAFDSVSCQLAVQLRR